MNGYPRSPEQIIPFTREWHNPPTGMSHVNRHSTPTLSLTFPPAAHVHNSTCDEHGRCMDGFIVDIVEKHLHVFGPDKPATK